MRLCATYYIERQIYLALNIPEEEGSLGEMENKQELDEMEDSIRTVSTDDYQCVNTIFFTNRRCFLLSFRCTHGFTARSLEKCSAPLNLQKFCRRQSFCRVLNLNYMILSGRFFLISLADSAYL